MLPGLFTRIVDFNGSLIRNIKGIRTSQHLFDDLANSDAEHALATLAAEQDYIDTRAALLTRPFDYGAVITYPFVAQNWQASRFSDGARYGVWYGSQAIETTVYETVYHWRRFVDDSFAGYDDEIRADRRVFTARCRGILVDLQGKEVDFPGLIDPKSYVFTHAAGDYLKSQRQNGCLVKSARSDGINAAILAADVLSDAKDLCYLTYLFTPAKKDATRVIRERRKLWMTI
ncbi:MAG: RES family NAD+ phosphorylase [Burkholderiales bacterium]|nr:RES family NAD+ phosphorylase [Burkholderiales bacterium]